MRQWILLWCGLLVGTVQAGEATIAVAANFAAPVERLAEAFAAQGPHRVRVSGGSSGGLYMLITQGAPFDLFLSADQARPARLVGEQHALADTRCTYAIGRLVLWSADATRIGANPVAALTDVRLRHLAIASPDVAPYGAAAREVLRGLGLWEALTPRLVQGVDIGQAYHMAASGNAELAFVAKSSLAAAKQAGGSRWEVPAELHAPLAQDVVLLEHGRDNAAARAFLAFLGSETGRALIRAYGYDMAVSGGCRG